MTKHWLLGGIAAAALAAAAPQIGHAQEPRRDLKQCFMSGAIENWRAAPGASTIFIRAANSHYYRIDLARACSPLKWPDAHLITHSFGGGLICSPTDITLAASEGMGFSEPCFIHGMSELTPQEAEALPKDVKP
jgi:hypothetical protein